ncbi:hypothetical protein QWT69_14390 [Sporosarcina oncorhynchi]|uniref:Uncharacterized protein n=1 Tax=Sporosarcina oncorhynchi TaxID=3056444 RepID=A0ABZ0L3D8_9BACL|nr:hypothetical protein [Sporosarcina sp. T2O-4]WOV87046.1 hypothetical protein QWT69_14390 [Sporosarcina sp. T2O-4]
MDREESRRLEFKIPDLRKKELRSKLTSSEQRDLDKARAIKAEKYPNSTTEQYADKVRVMAIRNYTIIETTPKASFFQKLLKQENPTEYRLQFPNEKEDVAEFTFPYTLGLEIRQLMEDVGLGLDWPKMLPVDDGMCYTDPLEEDDKEWFESFPDPAWCASKLHEAKNLEQKAAAHSEDIVQVIQWIRTHWENGFNIYADIDPWEVDDL